MRPVRSLRPILAASLLPGIALALGIAMAPAPAHAQELEVAPITLELQPGEMATTLQVTNRGSAPVVLQARAFTWDQQGGVDNLRPTDTLMISPPISQLEAGAQQVLRLILRRPATSNEQAYRVLLDELPPPVGGTAIRLALRLSIPVFAESGQRSPARLDLSLANGAAGPELVATNTGGSRARLIDPVLSGGGRQVKVEPNLNPYVLPGATRRWHVLGPLAPDGQMHLQALTDAGPISHTLTIAASP